MKRAAIYTRVSTSKQSCANQVADLEAVAKRTGWNIVETYSDEGVSGASAQRPALEQLRRDAVRRKFDLVMVWDISRLGRSLSDLVAMMQEMNVIGVDLFFHQQSIDTTTPAGKLCFQIFGSLAEWEREMIRERVLAGLATARRKGKKLGRPSKMNDGTRNAVCMLRDKGYGIKHIAHQLEIGVGTVYKALSSRPPGAQNGNNL
jgi:DNA invertase Pin-like site-specific DNA recombinase